MYICYIYNGKLAYIFKGDFGGLLINANFMNKGEMLI